MFIKYCVFSLRCCDFSELCLFCCSTGVLPACCVYTHWHRGKTEKGQSQEYFKIFGKNTIFNEHPVSTYDEIIVTMPADVARSREERRGVCRAPCQRVQDHQGQYAGHQSQRSRSSSLSRHDRSTLRQGLQDHLEVCRVRDYQG